MPGYYYMQMSDYTVYLLIFIPVFIFSLYAQIQVQHTFSKYQQLPNARHMTGADAARVILDRSGLYDVQIERISGKLTDHYDPRANVIRLSESVYGTASIAAVGVAAHEAGHAVQYAEGYGPIRFRSAIVGVTQFASKWSIWILMLGFLFQWGTLALAGFLLYAIVAFFQLVTLPVEFNASSRALHALEGAGTLGSDELKGAKKVLSAAAMTYVAALAAALVQLLRLWMIISGGSRRKND